MKKSFIIINLLLVPLAVYFCAVDPGLGVEAYAITTLLFFIINMMTYVVLLFFSPSENKTTFKAKLLYTAVNLLAIPFYYSLWIYSSTFPKGYILSLMLLGAVNFLTRLILAMVDDD